MSIPSVYLAGPDVFYPDAEAHFQQLVERLRVLGWLGLVPADGGLAQGTPPSPAVALRIYHANMALLHRAEAVLVNLNPFRGTEPDSGTCFEMGVAVALGKRVVAYVDEPELYADRVARLCGEAPALPGFPRRDGKTGCVIEAMGLPLNLMLACSAGVLVTGGLDEALHVLAEREPCPSVGDEVPG